MRSGRSLFSREYGFELAGFERAIIQKKDVGFVVKVDHESRYFRLAPSPFLNHYKTLYVVEKGVDIPPKGAFIRVSKYEEKQFMSGREVIKVKVVRGWEFADFSSFLKEKPVFDFDDLWIILGKTFKKPRDDILSSIAIYLASSPPYDILRGGLVGLVVARKQTWYAYKRIFDYVIPREFQRETAPYYYGYQYNKVDPYQEPLKPYEVCMDYVNPPEPMYFHIPQPLVNIETNPVSEFDDLFKDYGGGLAGYMLHYLHLQPKVENQEVLDKRIEEIMLEIKRVDGDIVLPPDFTFLERIAKAVARLKLREKVKKEDLDFVENIWLDCYKESLQLCKKPIPLAKYYSLGRDEKIIYALVKDLAVNDKVEKRVIVEEGVKLFGDEFYIEKLLERLIRKGYLYQPRYGVIKIVDCSQIIL